MNRDLFRNLLDNQISLLQKVKADSKLQDDIHVASNIIISALKENLPFLVMGNGGSAADAMHITGELLGKFIYERRPLNAICLNSELAAITAISNDNDYGQIFCRQVKAHAVPNGVLLGISTSGNSVNIVNAFKEAKNHDMKAIALTGSGGGELKQFSDIIIRVPSEETPRIQELHIIIYHYICLLIDIEFSQK